MAGWPGETRVDHRQPAGCHPELAEAIPGSDRPSVHMGSSVEVVDLGGDMGPEGRWIEAVDRSNRRGRASQAGPELLDSGSDRGYHPSPVIQTRGWLKVIAPPLSAALARPSAGGASASASANALNPRRVRRNWPREHPIGERSPWSKPRLESMLDRHPAAARRRLDPPCHIHAGGRSAKVPEAKAEMVGVGPDA